MIRRKPTNVDDESAEDIKKMLAEFIKGFWLVMKVLLVVLILSPFVISSNAKSYLAKGVTYIIDVDSICEPCTCPPTIKEVYEKKETKSKDPYRGNGSL